MRKVSLLFLSLIFIFGFSKAAEKTVNSSDGNLVVIIGDTNWSANWITDPDCTNEPNSWYCFRKDFIVNEIPDTVVVKIAIDSKYWLWINGIVVVRQGGCSWGDWGDNRDFNLITNGFYYLELKGATNMADELKFHDDAMEYRKSIERNKNIDAINSQLIKI